MVNRDSLFTFAMEVVHMTSKKRLAGEGSTAHLAPYLIIHNVSSPSVARPVQLMVFLVMPGVVE